MSKKPGFQVVLYYVTAPSEEQLQGIWNFVLGKYVNDDRSAEDIDFSVEYDESLGGGFILKCGNEVYNWSTRGRLGQFNEKLQSIRKNVGADEDVISILRTTTEDRDGVFPRNACFSGRYAYLPHHRTARTEAGKDGYRSNA